jgi:hypothetical protein
MKRLILFALGVLAGVLGMPEEVLAELPQRSSGITRERTGTTFPFGSGSITHRSDGSSARSSPFGKGSMITERSRDGKTITGRTQAFGSGTITRWSDGTVTRTSPFGTGSLSYETSRGGQTITSRTLPFGKGTTTYRSDGSTAHTRPFGKGIFQRDTPATSSTRR